MTGNDHVRFGPGAAGKGPALRAPRRRPTGIRAVMGARWAHHDNVVRMAAALRPALQARGVPRADYLFVLDTPRRIVYLPSYLQERHAGRVVDFRGTTRNRQATPSRSR